MENVTDRISNPFGMRPPYDVDEVLANGGNAGGVVYGYGDANADFHVIGDYPGEHGGVETGVPFTDFEGEESFWKAVSELGFVNDKDEDERPVLSNLFLDYIHMSHSNGTPSEKSYSDHERFFDAELRAINAHILIPIGEKAVRHVLEEYTTQAHKLVDVPLEKLHADPVRGRGFLVVPVLDPREWNEEDYEDFVGTMRDIINSDYRQTKGVATLIG